ncbi:hypothetical protein B0H11DRAFT_1914973 [Mycena galericulata]|nr:hypothetical protein B0H11DRAFT_1914973 [Mycena galericulata]
MGVALHLRAWLMCSVPALHLVYSVQNWQAGMHHSQHPAHCSALWLRATHCRAMVLRVLAVRLMWYGGTGGAEVKEVWRFRKGGACAFGICGCTWAATCERIDANTIDLEGASPIGLQYTEVASKEDKHSSVLGNCEAFYVGMRHLLPFVPADEPFYGCCQTYCLLRLIEDKNEQSEGPGSRRSMQSPEKKKQKSGQGKYYWQAPGFEPVQNQTNTCNENITRYKQSENVVCSEDS